MAFSLTLDLSDRDLAHFEKVRDAARKAAGDKSEQEIVDCAAKLLADAQKGEIPDFIQQRLLRLDDLIAMVRDEAWAMAGEDRERVLSALVYFCDPDDVIPDRVEVLGFLDDAIMIELAVRELGHELDAYDDFCDFRQHQAERRGLEAGKVGRADWLDSRREELVDRMHARRKRDAGRGLGVGYGSSSGYGSGRSYSRAWRPGMFGVR
ncbi:MAG TPA: YkvA family protein [Xanthomonadaceae bacterium]|nr:YkvA family protein [Xanthomonadaceae bacterium]